MNSSSFNIISVKSAATFLVMALFAVHSNAQRSILQFEGYFNNIEHKAAVFNTNYTCDSLQLKDAKGKKPDAEQLICYINNYEKGQEIILFEKSGVALCIDESGRLFARDLYAEKPPYYLPYNIDDLLKGRQNIVVETDESDYDSLIIRAIPVKSYVLGRVNKTGANKLSIAYDHFVYPAKGELSPALMNKIYDNIRWIPEDAIVEDKIILLLPVNMVNIPGTFTLCLYDLKGNILKMYTGLNQEENIIMRENLYSGTYRYAIFFNGTIEVKKGMLNFKEPPKPE